MGHVQGKQAGLSKRRICQWLRLRRSTEYEQKRRKSAGITTSWATHQAGIRGFATAGEDQRRMDDGLPERVGDWGQTAERANHKRGGRALEKGPLGGGCYEHHRPQTGGNPRQVW